MTLPKLTGGGDYDILLVVGAKKIGMSKVTKNAKKFNLPEEKLLGDWIVCIPGFTLEKYRRLQRSHLSIFSVNCFGNILLHSLGLPFNSPLGNIGFYEGNYFKFLNSPREYMKKIPTFKEQKIDSKTGQKRNFVNLGDIWLSIMHYETFEDFIAMWEKRKPRINWDNLFIETHAYNEKALELFDALPYDKKVCFVPFKSNLDSAFYIDPSTQDEPNFTTMLINYAFGKIFYYDVFDMLLYGKKTPLIDM